MLTNSTGSGKRWTVNEALNWIAFRHDPRSAPVTVIPQFGLYISINVMGALAARAAGNPRSWPGTDGIKADLVWFEDREIAPAYYYRALVKRWMARLALTASELLEKWTADRQRHSDASARMNVQQEELNAALVGLNEAAASSCLMVYGRPADNDRFVSSRPREVIPAHYIDEIRSIDGWGRLSSVRTDLDYILRGDDGPFYTDIAFSVDDIKRLWPEIAHGSLIELSVKIPDKVFARVKKITGPKPTLREAAINAMLVDLRAKRQTPASLQKMKQTSLADMYGVKARETAVEALFQALSLFEDGKNSGKL